MIRKIFLLVFFSVSGFLLLAQEKLRPFQNWQFSKTNDTTWYQANVPGTVHTDLSDNNLIPNPFFGLNEYGIQWIGKENWQYRCFFDLPEGVVNKKNIEIVFEGLDTYSKIFLNDSLILISDNMFREWCADVGPFVKEKNNKLLVIFESAANIGIKDSLALPYKLPGGIRVFARKAQYQYGWDFSPRFVTCGIWKPVYLRSWDDIKVEDVQYYQDTVTDNKALLHAIINIESEKEQDCRIAIKNVKDNTLITGSDFTLSLGMNSVVLYFQIDTPHLWWTNELGEAHLYDFEMTLYNGASKIFSDTTKFGIRTLELIQQPDSTGRTFYFKLNGVHVFMKGANYIPADIFLPRITKSKYAELISDAVSSNMNMLRVWGGGVYEDDYFYDLCDENGILIWQDFMFACAMYPGDSAFLENVNRETEYQIKRLRNHPCIALWCGNNEIDEGWNNWGWQKQYGYSEKDSSKIWNDYQNIFEGILKNNVAYYDYGRYYWPSSPEHGWGKRESLQEGDSHYWGVWWGMEPFSMYEKKAGRFMSEYGFQSYPSDKTIETYLDFKIRNNNENPNPFWHNKHQLGFETIDTYLLRNYYDTASWRKAVKNYTYLSQLAQAYGIKTAIEAHRRAMPYCMGSLYWQFNDCWPGVTWSGIDYFGRKKALQYFVQKAFEPLILSITQDRGMLKVYAVSDLKKNIDGTLKLKIIDFFGKELWAKDTSVHIQSISSHCCLEIPVKDIIKDTGIFNKIVFVAELDSGSVIMTRSLYFFVSAKQLKLPKSHVKRKFKILSDGSTEITLTSKTLAKNVFLSTNSADDDFSDNYFDLLPGERKKVILHLSGYRMMVPVLAKALRN